MCPSPPVLPAPRLAEGLMVEKGRGKEGRLVGASYLIPAMPTISTLRTRSRGLSLTGSECERPAGRLAPLATLLFCLPYLKFICRESNLATPSTSCVPGHGRAVAFPFMFPHIARKRRSGAFEFAYLERPNSRCTWHRRRSQHTRVISKGRRGIILLF